MSEENQQIKAECFEGDKMEDDEVLKTTIDGKKIQDEIVVNSHAPNNNSSNLIKNTKYTLLNFWFYIFLGQVKTPASAFFFGIMIIQFNEKFAVTSLWASVFPFFFVLTLSAFTEFLDDFRRYKRDKEYNQSIYKKYIIKPFSSNKISPAYFTDMGMYEEIQSKDIKTGHILLLEKNSRVPADCIILGSEDENGEVFLRTDQLDGETDWKRRETITGFESVNKSVKAVIEGSNKKIYSFLGNVEATVNGKESVVGVDLTNTAWADTVIANTKALVLVVYVGENTRSKQNTYKPRNKSGLFDREVDYFNSILIIISALCTLMFTMMRINSISFDTVIIAGRFLILFSYLIPIGLKVTLDLARMAYVYNVRAGITVRTSSIQEELARVTYLLSDKTGTLTTNEMTLKKFYLGNVNSTYKKDDGNVSSKIADFIKFLKSKNKDSSSIDKEILIEGASMFSFVESLSVCHNVTPVVEEETSVISSSSGTRTSFREEINFQAASPDELAIIKYLFGIDVKLVRNNTNELEIEYSMGDNTTCIFKYTICCTFPFDSDLKRMGVVAKRENFEKNFSNILKKDFNYSKWVLFEKGADSHIMPFCNEANWINRNADSMAREGLRTLLVAKKELGEKEYLKFDKAYNAAKKALSGRSKEITKVQINLETNLLALGLTGVEDRLQDNLRETLDNLRAAKINVWMLTGDKIETAISIAKSSRLFPRDCSYSIIANCKRKAEVREKLKIFEDGEYDALVIDGATIEVIFSNVLDGMSNSSIVLTKNSLLEKFTSVTRSLRTVIGCRCTPTQKANMAACLKLLTKQIVCCIGDGGNDVSMITEADIGVGIEGKEGNQASLASDFSIKKFSDITELLFVHGRNCYINSSKLAHITIQRGIMQTLVQGIFSALISSYPLSILQDRMPMFFIVFTFPPVLQLFRCYDILPSILHSYPQIYADLKKRKLVSIKEFVSSSLITFIQSTILIIGFGLFIKEFTLFSIVVFISIVINEYLVIIISQRNRLLLTLLSIIFSFLCFVLSGMFMSEMNMDINSLSSVVFQFLFVLIVSLLPRLCLNMGKCTMSVVNEGIMPK